MARQAAFFGNLPEVYDEYNYDKDTVPFETLRSVKIRHGLSSRLWMERISRWSWAQFRGLLTYYWRSDRLVAHMPSFDTTFDRPFVVEHTKLQRIISVMEVAFGGQCAYTLVASMKDGSAAEYSTLEDLLSHDNRIANPIANLSVEAISRQKHQYCKVYFGETTLFDTARIRLRVDGPDRAWAKSLFASLEEQIERTFEQGIASWLDRIGPRKSIASGMLIIAMLLVLVAWLLATNLPPTAPLSKEYYDLLMDRVSKATTTDEKISAILDLEKVRLELYYRQTQPRDMLPKWNVQSVLAVSPFIIITILLFALFGKCYPTMTFAWGDKGEQYQKLLKLRQSLWNGIFVVIGAGILVSISSTAIMDFLPKPKT